MESNFPDKFESEQYRVGTGPLGSRVALMVEDVDQAASDNPAPGPAYAELTPEVARGVAAALVAAAGEAERAA